MTRIGTVRWESPIVVGDMVILDDENGTVTVFGLPVIPLTPRLYLPTLSR
jgi:hypothetical protein